MTTSMERRLLGRTGLEVSVVGLGTWAMGGDEWGPSDDQVSLEVLTAAVAGGVNIVDTADVYGAGHSEELIAEAIPFRSGVTVVTKGGWDIYTDPPVIGGARRRYDAEYLQRAVAESRRRLRRDRLDVYLLHNPDPDDLAAESPFDTLRDLKAREQVRWIGASVGNEQAAWAVLESDIDVIEVPCNVTRTWATRLRPEAVRRGVGVIAREPLERGLLTGKYPVDATFAPGDHRAAKGRDWVEQAQSHIRSVAEVAKQHGRQPADVALSFPLSYEGVACTVVGARTVDQLRRNIAGPLKLTPEDIAMLEGHRGNSSDRGSGGR